MTWKKNSDRGRRQHVCRRGILWILTAELILLVMVLGKCMGVKDRSTAQFLREDMAEAEDLRRVVSPAVQLKRGIYEVSVRYASTGAYSYVTRDSAGTDADHILADHVEMPKSLRAGSFWVYITGDSTPVYFSFEAPASEDVSEPYVIVDELDVVYLKEKSAAFALSLAAALFAAADLLLFLLCRLRVRTGRGEEAQTGHAGRGKNEDRTGAAQKVQTAHTGRGKRCRHRMPEGVLRPLGVLLIALAASIPLFYPGLAVGDDLKFHVMRIESLARGFGNGQFPVRISDFWHNGYGYAVHVFYGDILLYPFALLRLLGWPLVWTYKLYLFACSVATAGISRYVFARIGRSEKIGLAGAALYTLSTWRLVDMYDRCSLGEHSAMMFLPLILLAIYRMLGSENSEQGAGSRKKAGGGILLAAAFSGLLHTNILSLEMALVFLAFFSLLHVRQIVQKQNLRQIFQGIMIAASLNLWFLVPFIWYYLSLPLLVKKISGSSMQGEGLRYHDLLRIWGDGRLYTTGWPILLGILLGIVVMLGTKNRVLKRAMAEILMLTALFVFLASHHFPYTWLMEKLPYVYKIIGMLQFPWRFLTIICLLGTLLTVLALRAMAEGGRCRRAAQFLTCAVIAAAAAGSMFYSVNHLIRSQNNRKSAYGIWSLDTAETFEYVMDEQFWITFDQPQIVCSSDAVRTGAVRRENGVYSVEASNTGTQEEYMDLPLEAYPGYRAVYIPKEALRGGDGLAEQSAQAAQTGMKGGEKTRVFNESKTGTGEHYKVRVSVPAGFDGEIRVRFREPALWRISELISLAALLMLAAAFRRRSIQKNACSDAVAGEMETRHEK